MYSLIFLTAPPDAINHDNDVSAELVSLDSANITWRIPSDNNAPIISYTLMFCARPSNSTLCGTSVNVTVPVGELTRVGDQLNYTINGLLTEKMYEVVIRAENSVGLRMNPDLGDGFFFNSAGPDNGQVENISFISATGAVIVTWNLPPLALDTSDLNVSFSVSYFNNGAPQNVSQVTIVYNPMVVEQGVSINLEADSAVHTINVTAVYINPNLVSSQSSLANVKTLGGGKNVAVLIHRDPSVNDFLLFHLGATLMPGARVSNETNGNVLTVSWPPATNMNFLSFYLVSYTTSTPGSSTRRRRQASPVTVQVPSAQTSAQLMFTPYTDYMVNVDAVYTPPPDGNSVTIPLLPTTTFRSQERRMKLLYLNFYNILTLSYQFAESSPPLNPVAENVGILKIRLNWLPPANPQGNITAYRVSQIVTYTLW